MGKFDEMKRTGERLMESVEDFMDETVKASFGSLNSLAGIDPETLSMIRRGKDLMDLSMEYMKTSMEAFVELEEIEERLVIRRNLSRSLRILFLGLMVKNQDLLRVIESQLALLCEKK